MISEAPLFVLRLSKDERRVFQQNRNRSRTPETEDTEQNLDFRLRGNDENEPPMCQRISGTAY